MSAYSPEVLYIHIPKCGGVSVKAYMREHLEHVVGHWGHERHPDYTPPIGHIPLRDIPKYTGRPLDSWDRIVATVRSPYDQALSQWRFWADRYARGEQHDLDDFASTHHTLASFLRDGRCDFIPWYELYHGRPFWPQREKHAYPVKPLTVDLYQWFLTVDGAMPDNLTVVRMEDMAAELPKLLGVAAPFEQHENRGPAGERATQEYYDLVATSLLEFRFHWTWDQGWYEPWAEQEVRRSA